MSESNTTLADPLGPAVKALDALLIALDGNPHGPAAGAYRAAIRRHGQNLADTAGPEALQAAVAHLTALSPLHADDRRSAINTAWSGIEGWNP